MGVYLMGVHLMGVHLMGVYFIGVYLMGVHLMDVYFIGVYFMGMHLIGVHLTDGRFMGAHLMAIRLQACILNSRSYLRCNLPVEVTCPEASRSNSSNHPTILKPFRSQVPEDCLRDSRTKSAHATAAAKAQAASW